MKKNKLIVFLVSLLTLLVVGLSVNTNTASAKYGYAGKTTTPKSIRGTWYYKGWRNGQKKNRIYKLSITVHKINGKTLYKLNKKYDDKFWSKSTSWKTRNKVFKVTKNWLNGQVLKYQGKPDLMVIGWLPGSGDGIDYVPVTRRAHGKRVKALRISTGDYFTRVYAYKTRKLAR